VVTDEGREGGLLHQIGLSGKEPCVEREMGKNPIKAYYFVTYRLPNEITLSSDQLLKLVIGFPQIMAQESNEQRLPQIGQPVRW
jgi:hypothetical protein